MTRLGTASARHNNHALSRLRPQFSFFWSVPGLVPMKEAVCNGVFQLQNTPTCPLTDTAKRSARLTENGPVRHSRDPSVQRLHSRHKLPLSQNNFPYPVSDPGTPRRDSRTANPPVSTQNASGWFHVLLQYDLGGADQQQGTYSHHDIHHEHASPTRCAWRAAVIQLDQLHLSKGQLATQHQHLT